jgi:uroporphyrinogen III methyltransferase/synthase
MKIPSKHKSAKAADFIRIGGRPSRLAVVQVEEIVNLLKSRGLNLQYRLTTFKTAGDRDKSTPLTSNLSDNFFTDAVDQALLKGRIDVAVHSAKDLPAVLHPDLEIVALTPCLDSSDAWVSPVSFDQLPRKAKVGTSSFLRQESIKALRPDLKLVPVRGTIQERLQLIEQKKVDGIIIATCALKRLNLGHLIRDIFPWEGTPLQGQLAVVCRRDREEFKKVFQCIDVRRSYGKVFLVGAGPGDKELVTLKAIEVLKKADCVFYDYLADPGLLKYAPQAEHVYVGKRKGAHVLSQNELSKQLRLRAMAGQCVVRLKGGDPLIFGRGAEEIAYLRSFHIETGVIPGVSSATGIPSLLGIPLTARGISSSVSFVSAHGEDERSNAKSAIRIPDTDTVVFFMGLSKLSEIMQAFRKKGWSADTPVAIVSKGTRRDQQVLTGTLATIGKIVRRNPLKPPALIIVGKTVDFYKPALSSRNILFLGTHPQEYRSLGRLIHWPMIRISPVVFNRSQKEKLWRLLSHSDIVLLTSEYAVEYFFKLLEDVDRRHLSIQDKDFAVIGEHTAQALLDRGVHPTWIAVEETSEGMFKELKKRVALKGKTVFFPRSSLPNPYLKTELTKAGATVHQIAVYENSKPARRPLPETEIHSVIFTSPSTVVNFLKDYGKIPASWELLCKGPVSQRMLAKHGYKAAVIKQ